MATTNLDELKAKLYEAFDDAAYGASYTHSDTKAAFLLAEGKLAEQIIALEHGPKKKSLAL